MKSLSTEKIAGLEKHRTELQIKLWFESYSALKFLMEKDYPFEPSDAKNAHRWIYENFPFDCKLSSAWIDWTEVTHCKRWFPANHLRADLKIGDIINEFPLGTPQVFFDAGASLVAKTNLSYLAEYFDVYLKELPTNDTYIWSPSEKWVSEVPVSNIDYPYSVNFGYANSDWATKNNELLSEARGKSKLYFQ